MIEEPGGEEAAFVTGSAYQDWARRLAGAPAPGRDEAPREGGEPPPLPCDGRRLREAPRADEIRAEPVILRLDGAPRSPERDAARRALRAHVEEGTLRMDPHEREILRERSGRGANGVGAGDAVPFAELPELLQEDEAYAVHRPLGSRELDGPFAPVEWGIPTAIPADALGAASETLPEGEPDPRPCDGDPPVVGVIDDGIGFLNARFREDDATRTRFDAVWLQAFGALRDWPAGLPKPPFRSGQLATHSGAILGRAEIDWLLGCGLGEEAIYRRLSRALHRPGAHRSLERAFSHGTHVADLAAGADPRSGDPALRWPMLGVQLPPEAVDDTAGTYLDVLGFQAVRWILRRARALGRGPVIVNVSFGSVAGPKDGTRPVEWLIARELALFEAQTGRCARLNWAFGNARLNRQVARLRPGDTRPVSWRLQPDDRAASFLEIRPEGGRVEELTLEIASPAGGVWCVRAPAPGGAVVLLSGGREALKLYRPRPRGPHWHPRPDSHLVLAAAPTMLAPGVPPDQPRAAAGAHALVLRWDARPAPIRLEVQRGDTPIGRRANGRQSYLDHPAARDREPKTVGLTGTGTSPITRAGTHSAYVTARSPDGAKPSEQVMSTGAARPGRRPEGPRPAVHSAEGAAWSTPGPAFSAPAQRGVGLRGLLGSGTLNGSVRSADGTSVAAPCASRALAATLEAEGCVPGLPRDRLARVVVAAHGAPADPAREALAPTHPDRLRPGDAARLGAGTITAGTGRRQG